MGLSNSLPSPAMAPACSAWRNSSIPQTFDDIAARYRDRTALTDGHTIWSYRDLQIQANRLANRLRRLGVTHETPVATFAGRSPELIAALLATLKAGGAYVPLDPQAPAERLAHILSDTAAPFVIASRELASRVPAGSARVLILEDEFETLWREGMVGPEPVSGPESLAYVMYTSGSTGTPKGALIEHRAVLRLVRDQEYIAFDAAQVFLALAPLSFDASTLEIWGALLNGGTLAVVASPVPSLAEIAAAIRRHHVTTLWLTSGLFNAMVDEHIDVLAEVRQVLAGGDVLSRAHVHRFLSVPSQSTLVNGYGPTEATTFTCCYRVPRNHPAHQPVPIGHVLNNTVAYVVDEHGALVPDGVTGELWIAGDGIARGYLGAPELTAERFVANPFDSGHGGRLYRTGDLVRRRPDGVFEFLGRADRQVKIRGFRIEPGEIEAAMNSVEGVRDSIVVVDEQGGEKRLVAYVAGRVNPIDVRNRLQAALPAWMVPAEFVRVDEIPLTANGKPDRSRLPRAHRTAGMRSFQAVAPGRVAAIQAIWRRVLGHEAAIDENFFDLGGSSLQLMRVHAEIERDLAPGLSITDLFRYPTIRSLAAFLDARGPAARQPAVADERARKRGEVLERRRTAARGGIR